MADLGELELKYPFPISFKDRMELTDLGYKVTIYDLTTKISW